MASVKIVVTGPFGAGKTTLIRTISEIAVLSTDRDISDHTRAQKPRTTVAMDFGRITVEDDLVLLLFGTPGQERFDFMWEILAEGMLGFVLMVDHAREESYAEAREILQAFRSYGDVPFVVAVNKHDPEEPSDAIEYAQKALKLEPSVPVIPTNALDRASVKNVLLALLYAVIESMDHKRLAASA